MTKDEFLTALRQTRRNSFGFKLIPTPRRIYHPRKPHLYVECLMIAVPMPNGAISGIFEQVWMEMMWDNKSPILQNYDAAKALGFSDRVRDKILDAVCERGQPELRKEILKCLKMEDIPLNQRPRHRVSS